MREARLTLVTDDVRRAEMHFFGRAAPRWAHVTDDPLEILQLPNGAKCFGLWFSPRNKRSFAEQSWIERRCDGGIVLLSDEDWAKFFAWRDGAPQETVPATPVVEPPAPVPSAAANSMLFQVWT